MNFWRRLLHTLGLNPDRPDTPYRFEVDADLIHVLQEVASAEHRSRAEVTNDLLEYALSQRDVLLERWEDWELLTPREQQVAALVCLSYTNPEIASRLTISPETVKTHVRNILRKLNLHSKGELRTHLSGWDFRAWDPGLK